MEKETASPQKNKSMFWLVTAAITAATLIIVGIMLYVVYTQSKISERRSLAEKQFIQLNETGEVVSGVQEDKRDAIVKIEIPEGVTTVGPRAFADCKNLASVKFPSSISAIGHEAFADCPALKELDIPEGLSVIGSEAFRGCAYFANNPLAIPASVRVVADGAFVGVYQVNLRDDDPDFRKEKNGEIVDIKDNKLIFVPPAALTGVYTTPEVDRIGGKAFKNGKKMTNIVISKKTFMIGEEAFAGCEGLTDVVIPGNVRKIGNLAFENCTALESVTFENGVKSLGKELFKGCKNIKSVTLPASVNTIADGAFIGVAGVRLDSGNIYFQTGDKGEIFNMINIQSDDKEKQNDRKLIYVPNTIEGEYEVPAEVKSIAPEAFNGCEKLTRVVVADDVAEIGGKAFNGCKNLVEVEIPGSLDDKNTEMSKRLEKLGLPANCKITVRKK